MFISLNRQRLNIFQVQFVKQNITQLHVDQERVHLTLKDFASYVFLSPFYPAESDLLSELERWSCLMIVTIIAHFKYSFIYQQSTAPFTTFTLFQKTIIHHFVRTKDKKNNIEGKYFPPTFRSFETRVWSLRKWEKKRKEQVKKHQMERLDDPGTRNSMFKRKLLCLASIRIFHWVWNCRKNNPSQLLLVGTKLYSIFAK